MRRLVSRVRRQICRVFFAPMLKTALSSSSFGTRRSALYGTQLWAADETSDRLPPASCQLHEIVRQSFFGRRIKAAGSKAVFKKEKRIRTSDD